MARLGEIPHTPYYGTADATPLFVLLFAETVAWAADERLYRDLLPNVRRALAWMEGDGDPDGDALIEYRARATGGAHIIHQGWKDSHDSLHHADGRPARGTIALAEVQGYAFAAYRRLAEVVAAHGDGEWAATLRDRARRIQERVEDAFWLEDEGFYAQALDGDKSPVAAISSNPGHLLFCGLPSPERGARAAERLAQPDMDSGWGVRTLSAAMPTYNPMSYHNGSVWPHDNSLIAAGMRAYGRPDLALRIAAALFAVAETDPLWRLPELYCGFHRAEGVASDAPVPYPVSCSPQAWAAGAGPLAVRTMLGLTVDVGRGRLLVDPSLPEWLGSVTIEGMDVLGTRTSMTVRRDGPGYRLSTDGPAELRTAAVAAG
jgi:glycogen debranching enzyme